MTGFLDWGDIPFGGPICDEELGCGLCGFMPGPNLPIGGRRLAVYTMSECYIQSWGEPR